jgi:hypothetical protein
MSNHREIAPVGRPDNHRDRPSQIGAETKMTSAAFNKDHAAAKAAGSGKSGSGLHHVTIHDDSHGHASKHKKTAAGKDDGYGYQRARAPVNLGPDPYDINAHDPYDF